MTRKEKIQIAIKKLEDALDEIIDLSEEDELNFVGSLIVFDKDGEVSEDSVYWHLGDKETCLTNASCLVNDIVEWIEDEKIYDINLN